MKASIPYQNESTSLVIGNCQYSQSSSEMPSGYNHSFYQYQYQEKENRLNLSDFPIYNNQDQVAQVRQCSKCIMNQTL